MTQMRPLQVPDAFQPLPNRGPFIDVNGPIWHKPPLVNQPRMFGLFAEDRHTNSLGFVHGGMISTVLDSSMAQVIFETHQCRLVTRELNLTFHHAVFKRRWAEIEVVLLDQSGSNVSLEAHLISRQILCAEATGTYQIFKSKNG